MRACGISQDIVEAALCFRRLRFYGAQSAYVSAAVHRLSASRFQPGASDRWEEDAIQDNGCRCSACLCRNISLCGHDGTWLWGCVCLLERACFPPQE